MTAIMSANKLRKRLLGAIALVLVVSSLFGMMSYAEGTTANSDSTTKNAEYDELQSRYEQLESEKAENQGKLDKVQSDIYEQEHIVDGLGNQLSSTQKEVDLLLTRYNLLNSEITSSEKQIDVITSQIGSLSNQIVETREMVTKKKLMLEETYELLKLRIRAMYMAGNGSNLEFLLTSTDFSTLLMRTELLVRVAQHDNNLMASLQNEIGALELLEEQLQKDIVTQQQKKEELAQKTKELEGNKIEIQATKNELETKQQQLEIEMGRAEAELENLDKESDEYKAIISKQEDELIALSKQMEDFVKNNGSSTSDKPSADGGEDKDDDKDTPKDNPYLDGTETVFSSGMIFPLKCSGVYISSPYGMRTHPTTGEYKLHTGTDFCAAGINGKTVYAVKDGEVIYAAKHKAYGNFVIIDHGKGISSCYAHMQDGSMTVSVGDKVLQGQPIGKVGSTGYSTGPHLHFEIRVDGATTNPMGGYVKLPG